ncbi:MAG TPA: hypothetical protein VH142_02910 [Polyangiaceae bacterium]|jgi:hypothetical protein|nr:hypothetical protein [Polyangiaceae bacterium]
MNLVPASDLLRPEPIPTTFGPWRFHRSKLTLELVVGRRRDVYEVDLERCETAAACLDWIMQIAAKTWATPDVIAGLVDAFDALLDPQTTLCSFGQERGPIDPARVIRARLAGQRTQRRLTFEVLEPEKATGRQPVSARSSSRSSVTDQKQSAS